MHKILIAFGTRPEAIKMAPLIKEFQKYPELFSVHICVTGQHREMLDQVMTLFGIKADFDLNIMTRGQDLYDVTARILLGMRSILKEVNPDIVLVHGDTTTSIAIALASFYQHIAVGHIEAGLRTHNIYSPWPEEMNRQLTGRIAKIHFAPTSLSKENLMIENIHKESIVVTGNTIIDALFLVLNKMQTDKSLCQNIELSIKSSGYNIERLKSMKKLILITGHRRENFGDGFLNVCHALEYLANKYPEVDFVYPMHLNPNVRNPISRIFNGTKLTNLFFIEPLEYFTFVYLMQKSYIILTDSGGVQEEAPSLGKPVLVMRDTTERPEAISAGTVKLVGTDTSKIINEVEILLNDSAEYFKMSNASNPYGDGNASKKITQYFIDKFYN